MQISPILLYAYGFNKYMLSIYDFNQRKHLRQSLTNPQNAAADSFSEQNTTTRNSNSYNNLPINSSSQACCDGYGTHIAAIVILLLILAAKSSTLYALTLLYQVII